MTPKTELTLHEQKVRGETFFQAITFICLLHLLSFRECQALQTADLPPRSTYRIGKRCHSQCRHVTRLGIATTYLDGDFDDFKWRATPITKSTPTTVTSNPWEIQFQNLERFHQEYGHANVPQHPSEEVQQSYPQLIHFCKNQRSLYKTHKTELTPLLRERRQRLESLGFDFDVRQCLWDTKYEKLYAFWKEHGHLKVAKSEHPDLYSWMYYQRQKYKSSDNQYKPLTKNQVERLERINFCWNPKEEEWWNNLYMLQKHKEEYGNWDIRKSKIRLWKNSLRRSCREYVLAITLEGSTDGVHVSGLNDKRIKALRDIRFCWLPNEEGQLKEDPPKDIFDGYQ